MPGATTAPEAALDQQIGAGVRAMGLPLDDAQINKLAAYVRLLEKWNRTYNLTAVREPERMVPLHILDSLTLVPHLSGIGTLLDVGTGAGLPAIPVAIALPAMRVTALDTIAKKTTFVRQAAAELGLSNLEVVTDRIENYRPAAPFDAVVSRAFADLTDFVACAARVCRPAGKLLAMKGVFPHDELSRLAAPPTPGAVISLTVPGLDAQRHLVILENHGKPTA